MACAPAEADGFADAEPDALALAAEALGAEDTEARAESEDDAVKGDAEPLVVPETVAEGEHVADSEPEVLKVAEDDALALPVAALSVAAAENELLAVDSPEDDGKPVAEPESVGTLLEVADPDGVCSPVRETVELELDDTELERVALRVPVSVSVTIPELDADVVGLPEAELAPDRDAVNVPPVALASAEKDTVALTEADALGELRPDGELRELDVAVPLPLEPVGVLDSEKAAVGVAVDDRVPDDDADRVAEVELLGLALA